MKASAEALTVQSVDHLNEDATAVNESPGHRATSTASASLGPSCRLLHSTAAQSRRRSGTGSYACKARARGL